MTSTQDAANDRGRLSGKTAFVTGAGSGIGKAISLTLALEGARVIVSDIDLDAAANVAVDIEKIGQSAEPLKLDVADPASWASAAAALGGRRIDILVSNAGVMLLEPVETMTYTQWSKVIDINLGGVFLGLQFARNHIAAGKGSVVNIASTAGLGGTALASAYSASKAGVISLTRSTARDFAQPGVGIRVNAICPGPVETPIYDDIEGGVQASMGGPQSLRAEIAKMIPGGEFGTPADVAMAVAFLASGQARFITGAVLTVDGGQAA